MPVDLKASDIEKLFVDPKMFDSRSRWQKAGFQVFERRGETKMMVASHGTVNGYLFKKYANDVDWEKQRLNYETRITGAEKLRAIIVQRGLRRIAVPHKRIFELPNFGTKREPSYVLVVEHLRILDTDASEAAYGRIDDELLEQLCIALVALPGLDSSVMNLPFTENGGIAFIDTEHWYRREGDKPALNHVRGCLSHESEKRADKLIKRLYKGD